MPKGIVDPALATALQTFVTVASSGLMVASMTLFIWLYVDSMPALFCNVAWQIVIIISLISMKLGFATFSRALYFTGMCTLVVAITQILGPESFIWVYLLQAPSGNFFLTTPDEKFLRKFNVASTVFWLLVTLLVTWSGIYPSVIGPGGHKAIVYFGNFNVVYSTFLLLVSVIKYQQEVTLYKKRIENQSLTMLQQAKMSSLGEMAAGVAHEINNPLGVIVGKIEVMENRLAQNQLEPGKLMSAILQKSRRWWRELQKLSAPCARLREMLKMIPLSRAKLMRLFWIHSAFAKRILKGPS